MVCLLCYASIGFAVEDEALAKLDAALGVQVLGDIDLGESYSPKPQSQKSIDDMYALFGHAPPKPLPKMKKAVLKHRNSVSVFDQLIGMEDKKEEGESLEGIVEKRESEENTKTDWSMNNYHDASRATGYHDASRAPPSFSIPDPV